MFTDEKYFCLRGKLNRQNDRVWATNSSEVETVVTVKHDLKIMVWGGITWNGTTNLIFLRQS